MGQSKAAKTPTVVTITTPWQIAFITTVVLSQLAWIVELLWTYTRHGSFIGVGTWIWQISFWLYPLAYLAVGYLFVRRRVQGRVPRLFWAVFLATIAATANMAESSVSNWLRYDVFHFSPPYGGGLWTAFGWDWAQMTVVFVLFCTVLGVLAKRRRA